MKIVDVCAFYTPRGGGVRSYIEQKLRIGPQLGHEVVVLAPGERDSVIDYGPNSRIVAIASPRFPLDRKYGYFDDEARLHAILDAEKPDVVEVSSPWRSPVMVGRWRGNAVRSLFMHADPLSAYAYRWLEPLLSRSHVDRRFDAYWRHLRQLSQNFHLTICSNDDLAARLRGGGVLGVEVHPLGIEPGVFSPKRSDPELRRRLLKACGLNEDAHLLIAAGRLAPEKRWPMVIEAVAAASRRVPVGLVLFGEGRDYRKVQRAIGGNPHIRLFEPERNREHFAQLLASADGLIHGCEAETFCMVAAEARASGTPVIVPNGGGAAVHASAGAGLTFEAADARSAARAVLRFCRQDCQNWSAASVTSNLEHFEALFERYARARHCAQAA